MTISDKILELRTHREAIREAINDKGVDLAEGSHMSDYAGAINEISGGGVSLDNFGNYTLLTPDMVSGSIGSTNQRYIGTATHLFIDDSFPTTNLNHLFSANETVVSLVILTDKFTDLIRTFYEVGTQLKNIFINTSNVTNMGSMFRSSQATTLDLSSFDTSNVTNMGIMFQSSQATILDLSSFDTSNVTNMSSMFKDSQATVGYARTQADADRFNASSNKPAGLTFVVKT